MSREARVAAIIRYQSAANSPETLYRIRGWIDPNETNQFTAFDQPAYIARLGADGWHNLEHFDSTGGSGKGGLKTRDELIATAKQRIEGFYESGSANCATRTFPFPIQ